MNSSLTRGRASSPSLQLRSCAGWWLWGSLYCSSGSWGQKYHTTAVATIWDYQQQLGFLSSWDKVWLTTSCFLVLSPWPFPPLSSARTVWQGFVQDTNPWYPSYSGDYIGGKRSRGKGGRGKKENKWKTKVETSVSEEKDEEMLRGRERKKEVTLDQVDFLFEKTGKIPHQEKLQQRGWML